MPEARSQSHWWAKQQGLRALASAHRSRGRSRGLRLIGARRSRSLVRQAAAATSPPRCGCPVSPDYRPRLSWEIHSHGRRARSIRLKWYVAFAGPPEVGRANVLVEVGEPRTCVEHDRHHLLEWRTELARTPVLHVSLESRRETMFWSRSTTFGLPAGDDHGKARRFDRARRDRGEQRAEVCVARRLARWGEAGTEGGSESAGFKTSLDLLVRRDQNGRSASASWSRDGAVSRTARS